MKKVALSILFAFTAALVGVTSAVAGETVCVGVVAGVHENILVPENGFCHLIGAVVTGNVTVRANARLRTTAG